MKNIAPIFIMGAMLLAGCFLPAGAQAQGNQGHHQSGIIGHVNGGGFIATPDGVGSRVIPDYVRVYNEEDELVAEVETQVMDEVLWYFEVYLKPGTYTIIAYAGTAPEDGGIRFTYPLEVTVEKKQFAEVALSFVPFMPSVPLIY